MLRRTKRDPKEIDTRELQCLQIPPEQSVKTDMCVCVSVGVCAKIDAPVKIPMPLRPASGFWIHARNHTGRLAD